MDERVQKSCWGVTAWAMAGFALIVVVMLLAGVGAENASVVAAS